MAAKATAISLIERTRRRLGLDEPTFVPTPNTRNSQMMQEAEEFALHMATFEHAVRVYCGEVQDFISSLIPLMDTNLPRVWRRVPGTNLCEPVRTEISHGHPSRAGGVADDFEIRRQVEVVEGRMLGDIARPVRAWLVALDVGRDRYRKVERLRSSVDNERRRSDRTLRASEARLREAFGVTGVTGTARRASGNSGGVTSSAFGPPDDFEYDFGPGAGARYYGGGASWGVGEAERVRALEDYERLGLHEGRRLAAYTESFREQERLLFDQLSGIARDAAWLESYCAAAMLVVKETLQAVALSMGPSKQPLPTRRAMTERGIRYGALADNTAAIAELAPRAREIAVGSPPRAPRVRPYAPLQAKRGLAQPLQLALASSDEEYRRLALEPVPPVVLPATFLPEAAVTEDMRRREEERVRTLGLEGPAVAPEEPAAAIAPQLPRFVAPPAGPPAAVTPEPLVTPQRAEGRLVTTPAAAAPAARAAPMAAGAGAAEAAAGPLRLTERAAEPPSGMEGARMEGHMPSMPPMQQEERMREEERMVEGRAPAMEEQMGMEKRFAAPREDDERMRMAGMGGAGERMGATGAAAGVGGGGLVSAIKGEMMRPAAAVEAPGGASPGIAMGGGKGVMMGRGEDEDEFSDAQSQSASRTSSVSGVPLASAPQDKAAAGLEPLRKEGYEETLATTTRRVAAV